MEVGTRTWALCRIPQGILKQLLRCRATNEPAGWRPLPPSGAVGKGLVDWCVRVTSTCIQEPNVPQQKIVSWWLLSVHLSNAQKRQQLFIFTTIQQQSSKSFSANLTSYGTKKFHINFNATIKTQ